MKKQIKSQLKLLPLLLGISVYSLHAQADEILFELNNGQTHTGTISDSTQGTVMIVDIDQLSTLNGDLLLSGDGTQYNVGLSNGSAMNGDISFSSFGDDVGNNGVNINNQSTLTGNIIIGRGSSASISLGENSRWDGRLDAAAGFDLDISGSTKTGGIFYNSGDTPSNDSIQISVGGGWGENGETLGRLEGPIKIIGQTDPSVDMTNTVGIFIGEGGVVDAGPEGLLLDNNGQGLHFSSETEGGIPASWKGDIVVKENSDPDGTTHGSQLNMSGGFFEGDVSIPVLERLTVSDSSWKGNIDIVAHNDNAVDIGQAHIDISHSLFQGNINYSGKSDLTARLSESQVTGNINAVNTDDVGSFYLDVSGGQITGNITVGNMVSNNLRFENNAEIKGDIVIDSGQQDNNVGLNIGLNDNVKWQGNLDLTRLAAGTTDWVPIDIQNSEWTGHIINGADRGIEISLYGDEPDGAAWNITGNSDIHALQTHSNASVNFVNADNNSSMPQFHTLTVDVLESDANLVMRVSQTDSQHDKLVVKERIDGDVKIMVQDNPSASVVGNQTYHMVDYTTAENNGSFEFTNNEHKIELGGYVYEMILDPKEGTFSIIGKALPTPGGTGSKPILSTAASSAANSLVTGYLFNEVEVQNLQQRLGDLRNHPDHLNNVWAKNYNGQFDSKQNGLLQGFDMDYNGIQIGADTSIDLGDNSRLYLGAMTGTTRADVDYTKDSTGTVKDYQFGVYATYLTDNAFYVDTIAKYSRVKQDINAKIQSGGHQKASASKNVYNLSVQTGKRFHLSDEANKGFYAEPQAQLIVTNNEAAHFQTDRGLNVDIDAYTSVQARGGVQLGYQFDGKLPVNVYAKSQLIHEFGDAVEYRLNGSGETHSFKGSRWSNGIGTAIHFGKQHTLYADVVYEDGNKYKQTQWNIGYRLGW